jgi:hypothetical protein
LQQQQEQIPHLRSVGKRLPSRWKIASKNKSRWGKTRARVLGVREKCGARQRSLRELGHPGLKRDVYILRPSNRAVIDVSNESSIFFAPQISAKTTLGHATRASRFQNERSTFLAPRLDPSSRSQMSAQLSSPFSNLRKDKAQWRH